MSYTKGKWKIQIVSESKARTMTHCPACGAEKSINSLVCWDCFKYRKDIPVFKYADMSFEKWLAAIAAAEGKK